MLSDMLHFVETEADCFLRSCKPGHLTASAWVVAKDTRSALMLHHAKLDKWLQPGGHADGEEDLEAVARRELVEETGLDIAATEGFFFDVDIHEIPARGHDAAHFHFDLRFLFLLENQLPFAINHESREARWVQLDKVASLNGSRSIVRMVEKALARM